MLVLSQSLTPPNDSEWSTVATGFGEMSFANCAFAIALLWDVVLASLGEFTHRDAHIANDKVQQGRIALHTLILLRLQPWQMFSFDSAVPQSAVAKRQRLTMDVAPLRDVDQRENQARERNMDVAPMDCVDLFLVAWLVP